MPIARLPLPAFYTTARSVASCGVHLVYFCARNAANVGAWTLASYFWLYSSENNGRQLQVFLSVLHYNVSQVYTHAFAIQQLQL